jgi:hypothetical protein
MGAVKDVRRVLEVLEVLNGVRRVLGLRDHAPYAVLCFGDRGGAGSVWLETLR